MKVARQRQFYTLSVSQDSEGLAVMVDIDLKNNSRAPIDNSGQEKECKGAFLSDRGLNENW